MSFSSVAQDGLVWVGKPRQGSHLTFGSPKATNMNKNMNILSNPRLQKQAFEVTPHFGIKEEGEEERKEGRGEDDELDGEKDQEEEKDVEVEDVKVEIK